MGRQFGSGAFGEIFMAQKIDGGEIVALKREDSKSKHAQLN